MKRQIEIFTYFILIGSDGSGTLQDKKNFSNWDDAELYLKDRIQLKRKMEVFKIEISGVKFSEFNASSFHSLIKIKECFLSTIDTKKKNAEEKKIKSERIFVRLFPNEKIELEKKAKKQKLTLSEYVRQSVISSKIVQISDEERRILNNASLNFNQFIRAINEQRKVGEAISIDTINNAFKEWDIISLSFRELINKYESRNPKDDSENN